jgi:signal transduction histidine kinase
MQTTHYDISQVVSITRQLKIVVLILILAVVISTAVAAQMFWHFTLTSDMRPDVFFETLSVTVVLCLGVALVFNKAIHKQQLLEERIRELEREQLRAAKLETILDVAVTVNHEVNNPLTTILTGSQFLLRRLPDADDMTRLYLSRIAENAERIAQVTHRLREVTEPLQKQYTEGTTMLDLEGRG